MEKILIPTDFSETAHYAFETACQLAKLNDIELHLYHAMDIPSSWKYLPNKEEFYDKFNLAISTAATDELERLQKEASTQGIKCDIHLSDGRFVNHLQDKVHKLDINLVIMGSHGTSGKSEWFIGSNAQRALRKLDINVLVVKKPIKEFNFSKVMFATNLMVEDRSAFLRFLDFIKIFPIKEIHVLTIKTSSFFTTPSIVINAALQDFKELAPQYDCYVHHLEDYSVDNGIRQFANQHDIELIGISNHRKHPIRHILRGSNVEIMINHTELPVLSIDYVGE